MRRSVLDRLGRDRRIYYGLTFSLALAVAFAIFSHRIVNAPLIGPVVSLGRQANEAAYQRGTAEHVEADTTESTEVSQAPPAYFDPAVYAPDLPNPTPLTELGAKACLWPPTVWDVCTIDSSPREDASLGPWVRVDGDMDKRVGIYYSYLFYRRKPAYSNLPGIIDIKLLTDDDAAQSPVREQLASEAWIKADGNLRAGVWPRSPALFAWYMVDLQNSEAAKEPFTELEVVYGLAGARAGWELIGPITALEGKTEVSLLGRRRPLAVPPQPELLFSNEGNYTILQLADFHFSTEKGECRDTNNVTACPTDTDADLSSIQFLNSAIDQVKPDFIMLSGDQINGQGTSWSARSAILKVARIFEHRTIPWAAIFGNHDGEDTDVDRLEQMSFMQTLPYFVGSVGPPTVDGVGNYLLKIKSADPSHTHLFSIYALDSHAYSNTLFSSAYDWIKESQIRWFKEESANISLLLRPYKAPDLSTEKGLFGIPVIGGGPLQRLFRRQAPGQVLKKPNALAFWHIPLPEVDHDKGLPVDLDPVNRSPLMVGEALETSGGGPSHNSHFFDALTSVTEIGSTEDVSGSSGAALASNMAETYSAAPEVKITAHGHQHLRASCERRKGIWSCFAGGSTYSGYGRTYFDRRVRVFHVSQYGERVETWQLVDSSATDAPPAETPQDVPPEGGIGGSEAAEQEADLEEAILDELKEEGIQIDPPARQQRRQHIDSGIVLKRVDAAVLVGEGALGTM